MAATRTILVVEDDPQLRRLLSKHLEGLGHSVQTVDNGELAISWLKDHDAPHLICLDLALPTMSGFRVCETVRSMEKTRAVPVLVITARTSVQDHTFALEVGADAFLEKPFKLKDLEQSVDDLLGPGT